MSLENSPPQLATGLPTIQTRGHTTPEGVLNLSVAVGFADAEVTVILQVKPIVPATAVDANGWPIGFFDKIAGSMPDLERPPQGEYEERLRFE